MHTRHLSDETASAGSTPEVEQVSAVPTASIRSASASAADGSVTHRVADCPRPLPQVRRQASAYRSTRPCSSTARVASNPVDVRNRQVRSPTRV
jgi:hypothetical protein